MIGQLVRIATKPDADDNSYALTFRDGLGERPLLTRLEEGEKVRLGACGTEISFELRADLEKFQVAEFSEKPVPIYEQLSSLESLTRYILHICPLANRPIVIRVNNELATLPSVKMEQLKDNWTLFNDRVLGSVPEKDGLYSHCQFLFESLKEVRDCEGELLGLVAPSLPHRSSPLPPSGMLVDGGLRVETLPTFFGIAHGNVLKADRATAQSALRKASDKSKLEIVNHFKSILAIEDGKCDLRKINRTRVAPIKVFIVAELLPFDAEFSLALSAKKSLAKGNDRLSDWSTLLRKNGRLIFYLPEFTEEELAQSRIYSFAYSMPNLPVLSQGSLLAHELLGSGVESIAKWMCEYFSREVGIPVKYRFGRASVGLRGGLMPVYCFGIAFRTNDKSESFSPTQNDILEMYKLSASEIEQAH